MGTEMGTDKWNSRNSEIQKYRNKKFESRDRKMESWK